MVRRMRPWHERGVQAVAYGGGRNVQTLRPLTVYFGLCREVFTNVK